MFNAEEKEKIETLQQAQKTRFFAGGPLAPDDPECTIWDFLKYIESKLGNRSAAIAAE